MLKTARSFGGMAVTPHRLASQSAANILRQGGTAVEAAVAAAACLSVVYPHMTGIGGDGFWLLLEAGADEPVYIDACGRSGAQVTQEMFTEKGLQAVPKRGPLAAITVAGAVSGWETALQESVRWASPFRKKTGIGLPPYVILADAVNYAENGFPVTTSQETMTRDFLHELAPQPGFAAQYLDGGNVPERGWRQRLPLLAKTLQRLSSDGFNDFYTGRLAQDIAADLQAVGSPLTLEDLAEHQAVPGKALRMDFSGGTLFNSPAPTQGVASLLILGLLERYAAQHHLQADDTAGYVHAIVEATKQAFLLRDKHVADPGHMEADLESLLHEAHLDTLTKQMHPQKARSWPQNMAAGGDTIWLGIIDAQGNAVSYIQSIYHEFGSGVVLPRTGIVWQNRGLGFTFAKGSPNSLGPRKKPFHTLNPAMARFPDGTLITYGTMGGEGQPQTQAALLFRLLVQKQPPQQAVTAPRWLLGRAWGDASNNLKIEENFDPDVLEHLRRMGHDVAVVPALSSLMGHAGMIIRHADGLLEGGFDPRSDGSIGCL